VARIVVVLPTVLKIDCGLFAFPEKLMPIYDTRCNQCEFEGEIEKPRDAALPPCPECGKTLKRVYAAPAVHYAVGGFKATDSRLEKMVGPERFAKFSAQKANVEARAKQGRLTEYERAVEAI
jgi:putative FmdB family regulatory protein